MSLKVSSNPGNGIAQRATLNKNLPLYSEEHEERARFG